MKKILFVMTVLVLIFSCRNGNVKKEIIVENPVITKPLVTGEFFFEEDDFGEVIELKGESKPVNIIFKVSETKMMVNDTILIVQNRHNYQSFMLFSLPGFNYIKSFGNIGNGPDEFLYPKLVSGTNSSSTCLILNKSNIYSLGKDLNIKKEKVPFPFTNNPYDNREVAFLSDSSFMYVESTKRGKEIFRLNFTNNQTEVSPILNLSFLKGHSGWATYIGDFGINRERNRMVYAYKYYKKIIFTQLDGTNSRIVHFRAPENETKDVIRTLGPDNITHYWGISAQKNYVYFLYSGRTPIDVGNDFKLGKDYIFVEQYDWNGNLVRKFRLDHWGYFCINESETKLYLASVNDENPFYVYDLPAVF
jgi:hypothetical protein